MDPNVRKFIIALLAVLCLASAGMAVIRFIQPGKVVKEVPFYKYQQSASVDYRVFFLPNPFFAEKSAPPGQGYLAPITDYVRTDFRYSLQGSGPTDIKGSYQVYASVTGYLIQESAADDQPVRVKVWEKTTPLVQPTRFTGKKGRAEINRMVRLNIKEYSAFAARVQDEYKGAVDEVELAVKYVVDTEIAAKKGKKQDQIANVLVIPIEGNSFTVGGLLSDTREGSMVTNRETSIPGMTTARIGYSLAAVLLALALFRVLTKTSAASDSLDNELRRIAKKHGTRIVSSSGAVPQVFGSNRLTVSGFEDLVKVADEVAQPILHENLRKGVHNFYVASDPLLFTFTIAPSNDYASRVSSNRRPRNQSEYPTDFE